MSHPSTLSSINTKNIYHVVTVAVFFGWFFPTNMAPNQSGHPLSHVDVLGISIRAARSQKDGHMALDVLPAEYYG